MDYNSEEYDDFSDGNNTRGTGSQTIQKLMNKVNSNQIWSIVLFVILGVLIIGTMVLVFLQMGSVFRPSFQIIHVSNGTISAQTMTAYILNGGSGQSSVSVTSDMAVGGFITIINKNSTSLTVTYTTRAGTAPTTPPTLSSNSSLTLVSTSKGTLTPFSQYP